MKKLLLALFCLTTVSGFSFDDETKPTATEEVTECSEKEESSEVSQS